MKEVMCVIRINKVNQTKEALAEAGFTSITFRKVLGRGQKSLDQAMAQMFIDRGEKVPAAYDENMSEKGRLIPKRLITLIVEDDQVDKVVTAVMRTNHTGCPGDGKIFVLPLNEVYRVRDGATGAEAV